MGLQATTVIETQNLEALISTEVLAKRLDVSTNFLEQDRVTRRHGIPFVRIGRAVRYRPSEVEAWLASRRDVAVAA